MWHEVSLYLFNMLLSDWLVYLYDGTLCENPVPVYALAVEMAPMSQAMVRELGVYRDKIPQEKEASRENFDRIR